MNSCKEGNKFLKVLMTKIGFKDVLYRLHLGKSYGYMWFSSDETDNRRSPVEMVVEIISMGVAAGHYTEVLNLLNHFNSQLFEGRYAPADSLLGEVIQNLQDIKNNEIQKIK